MTSVTGRPWVEKCLRKSASVILGGRFLTKSLEDFAVAGSGSVWCVDITSEGGAQCLAGKMVIGAVVGGTRMNCVKLR